MKASTRLYLLSEQKFFRREVQWPYLGPPGASTKGKWKPPVGLQIEAQLVTQTAAGLTRVLLQATLKRRMVLEFQRSRSLTSCGYRKHCSDFSAPLYVHSSNALGLHGFLRPRGLTTALFRSGCVYSAFRSGEVVFLRHESPHNT